jgi:hypothetical protein
VHHAIAWTTEDFNVVQGEDQLDSFTVVLNQRTTAIVRFVCKTCHDCLYNTSTNVAGIVHTSAAQYNRGASATEGGMLHDALQPTQHLWYSMRMISSMHHDGLPKFLDLPEALGGTGTLFEAPSPRQDAAAGDADTQGGSPAQSTYLQMYLAGAGGR